MESNHDFSEPVMPIGTLAEKVGLSDSAVRKYENEGLILAFRTPSGHRRFSHEDIDRIRNIQRMVQELGVSIGGIRRLQALLPCWDLLPCSTQKREQCPAYRDNARPCWMMTGLDCEPSHGNECRQCVVYRFGSLCTEEIKSVVYDQSGSRDAGTAIRELLDRKRHYGKEG
ncbi:MAG TPA: MerR family transcriptional regulator [Thermoguttaceae bacterium]|nr:MerR family transcriptional regulator [Thermoguttaceae bacterium]